MSSAIAEPFIETVRYPRAGLVKGLIWGFSLLLAGGIWWFVVAQVAFERRQALDDGIRQNINRTIAFEQYVRRTLEGADMATRYISERFRRGAEGGEFGGVPGRPALLQGSVARNGSFLGISVVDASGNIVATSSAGPLLRNNVAGHPAFLAHVSRDSDRLFVSQPAFSRALGQQVIWLSRRLNRPDGSFAGVVAMNISPQQFTAFYHDASIGPMDVMSVIGLDGITRARRTGRGTSAGEDFRGRRFMSMQMRRPNGTHIGRSAQDGVVRIFSHRRIQAYPLFVAYGVPESEVLAPSRHRASIFYAGAALVSLAILAFALLLTLVLNRRERRETEMARAYLRLQEAQRIGQIGDWDYDLRTGETIWSPQLLAMYERESLGSPTFDEFQAYLDEEGRAAIHRAHAEAIRTGQPQDVDYAVLLPSGAETHHQSAVIPTVDAAGKVVRLHGTDQDVSARKMLDLLQMQVAHLSRLEAMNAMAATLAHELNQPLTAASNYLVGSRRRLGSGAPAAADEVERGVIAAEQQVHLAADIIRRVREMVSNPPRAVNPVGLSRVVDDAIALLAVPSAYPGLSIRKRLATDAKTVRCDRIQIQQVLVNLIRNACDATHGLTDPEVVVASTRHDAASVTVSVDDNGPGFSQPASARFSPFATTKESGLGLGLSISRTIIESHGGRIWTEDREGQGARVCFTLPAPRRQPDRERTASAAA